MLQTEQVLNRRYRLKQQLGLNASRQTWLAEDLEAQERVTVKLLAFSPQMQWEEFKLFEREAKVLQQLNHPRIPRYRDYFSLDEAEGAGLPWFGLVQDYIAGESLRQRLDRGERFAESQVRSIATQVLEILAYLHELSPPVLHRDIKPSNLILGKDGKIYLVDFGAVRDRAAAEGVTFTVVGTAGYAPVEQFWGKAVPASDLYALGATLIHLLTGTPPADLPQSDLRIQFRDRVNIRPAFARWIETLTNPALEQRFSTARQALEALKTGRLPGEKSSTDPQPLSRIRYLRLGIVALLQVSAIGVCFIILREAFRPFPISYTQRAASYQVHEISRAQEAYFREKKAFSRNIAGLGLDLKRASGNYAYSTRASAQAAFNYAISRKDDHKSYIGAVFAVQADYPGAIKGEMTMKTILCEGKSPAVIVPALPTYQNGVLACGENTIKVGE
ncbi:MAG: protein kinase [Oscillatoria sp. Prado101]|jgi:serine/threonine protein kinase|nr:protein kinase [Oscillatoria sp. Prado101]